MSTFISQTKVTYDVPSEIVYERKFDTAIRSTFADSFYKRVATEQLEPADHVLLSFVDDIESLRPSIKDHTYLARIMLQFMTSTKVMYTKQGRKRQGLISEAMATAVEIQWYYLAQQNFLTNKTIVNRKFKEYIKTVGIPDAVANITVVAEWLSSVIDSKALLKVKKKGESVDDRIDKARQYGVFKNDILDLLLVFGHDVCLLRFKNQEWLIPDSGVLMIHNKACDIISVLMFAHLAQGNAIPPEGYQITLDTLSCLARLMIQYNTKFFDIAKALEALGIAETLVKEEEWTNREFLDITIQDLYDSTGFLYIGSPLHAIFSTVDTPFRHELMCLSKVMGHPYVDMEGGARSLYDKTTETYQLNLFKVQECINYIKLNYIQNHILRYKKWPPAILNSPNCPTGLTRAFVTGQDPLSKGIAARYGRVSVKDMVFVDLLANERFQYLENVIPYLKDKTISVLRSKVMDMYMTNQHASTQADWKETRLLLAYLLNPKIIHDHVKYIEDYNQSDTLDELLDYLVIRIVPKEKELKVKFRGFGCKTYEDRMRSLAQEKTTMTYLDKYSDEQAMTLGELELLKRLSSFRHLNKAYAGHKVLYIVIDASSWNNHFRRETVDVPLGETLDKIHASQIYSKTHLAYQQTLFYIPNKPVTYSWQGQSGGIEGLNQDSWVVIYIAQMKVAMEALKMPYHILCKGDDLRIAVAVPADTWKTTPMSKLKNEIVQRISDCMKDFGHTIKVLESYGSSSYFAFSKSASVSNIELPQGFRKIQRTYGASNAFIATLDEYIGCTFSNAHSTCKVEPNTLPSYGVALFWSLSYLTNHYLYANLTLPQLVALMLTPSVVGGFPIIYYHNMHVRAESDLLSPFFGIYQFCQRYYAEVAVYMSHFMVYPAKDPTSCYKMLYKDPYAIIHDRPPLPTAILRGGVEPVISRHTKNEDIRELLRASKSPEMEQILQILASCSELNSKILACLYAATPEGLLQELIRKFESARSINELVIKTLGFRKSLRLLRKVVTAEKTLQIWRVNRLRGRNNMHLQPYHHLVRGCPAKSAHDVRALIWGRPVTGITMPPLQHQALFVNGLLTNHNEWINENHFHYTISEIYRSIGSDQREHYATGSQQPFIGYSTRSGMVEPTVHFIDKDPLLTKIKGLIDIVTWTNISKPQEDGSMLSSNCIDVVKLILQSFTMTKFEDFAPFAGKRRSGTIQHHVRAPSYRESIVPNVLSNVYTRITGESNSHIRLRKSREHYRVNFLHLYCYATFHAFMELEVSSSISTPPIFWLVTTDCTWCNTPIEENPLVFDMTYGRNISLHPLAMSAIGQVAEEILYESIRQSKSQVTYKLIDDAQLPFEVAVYAVLQEIVDNSYTNRIALQTRYNQPTLTEEGHKIMINMVQHNKQRDIGQSEMRRIPLHLLANGLTSVILYYHLRLSKGEDHDTFQILYATLPGESLPWYGLVNAVFKNGRLPELVAYIVNMIAVPQPTCYYNPIAASKFLGRYASLYVNAMQYQPPLVILTYYGLDAVEVAIGKFLYTRYYVVFKQHYARYLQGFKEGETPAVNVDQEMIIQMAVEGAVVLSCAHLVDVISSDIAPLFLDHNRPQITALGVENITPMCLLEYWESPDAAHLTQEKQFKFLSRFGVTLDFLLGLDEDYLEQILGNVFQQLRAQVHTVYYTDIGQCVLTVRSHHPDPDDAEDMIDDRQEPVQLPLDPNVIVPIVLRKPAVSFPITDYVEPFNQEHCTPITSNEARLYFDIQNVFRIFGARTGSENYLMDILACLPDIQRCNAKVYALCLSDGYGGFASTFCDLYQNPTIVFHTLPETLNLETVAPTALVGHDTPDVITQHLDEGYYDLSLAATVGRFLEYNFLYNFVTCDIDLPDSQIHLMKDIYRNILILYFSARMINSILIMKVQLADPSFLGSIIDTLQEGCSQVSLMHPQSCNDYTVAYIVARSWKQNVTAGEVSRYITRPPSNGTIRIIKKFYQQMRRKINHYRDIITRGIDLGQVDYSYLSNPRSLWNEHRMQWRFPVLLQCDADVSMLYRYSSDGAALPLWNPEDWGPLKNHTELLTTMGLNVDGVIKMYKHTLRSPSQVYAGDQDDRAVHREQVYYKIAFLEGLSFVLSQYKNHGRSTIIIVLKIDEAFKLFYQRLRPRDRRGHDDNFSILREDPIVDNRRIRVPALLEALIATWEYAICLSSLELEFSHMTPDIIRQVIDAL